MMTYTHECEVCRSAFTSRKHTQATCSTTCANVKRFKKHGHSHFGKTSRTYTTWQSMRQRCQNPKATSYARYGGRGISVCSRWQNFDNFLADMGERPEGTSLDRIDGNGNYTPENCRWATRKEQQSHTSRAHVVSFHGESISLTDLARRIGIGANTLAFRMKHWPEAEWDLPAGTRKR